MGMRKMMKLKSSWDVFCKNHPKFPMFLEACNRNKLTEGTIVDIKITRPDGSSLCTNVKLRPEDIELLKELKFL